MHQVYLPDVSTMFNLQFADSDAVDTQEKELHADSDDGNKKPHSRECGF